MTPILRLTRKHIAVLTGVLAIGLMGDVLLPQWLGIDVGCWDNRTGRRVRLVELLSCSLEAGPRGWAYLGWFIALPALLIVWLRRRARMLGRPGGEAPAPPPS